MSISLLLVAALVRLGHVSLPPHNPCGSGEKPVSRRIGPVPHLTCHQPSGAGTDAIIVRVYNAAQTPGADRRSSASRAPPSIRSGNISATRGL